MTMMMKAKGNTVERRPSQGFKLSSVHETAERRDVGDAVVKDAHRTFVGQTGKQSYRKGNRA